MSVDILMTRCSDGALRPHDIESAEALKKFPAGSPVGVTLSQARKGKFHRLVFSLLGWAYDNTDHPVKQFEFRGKMIDVHQSFTSFRNELVIRSGHFHFDVSPSGDVRATAKSLKYIETTQQEIEEIYSDLLDTISRTMFNGQYTPEELRALDTEFERYAS